MCFFEFEKKIKSGIILELLKGEFYVSGIFKIHEWY